MRVLRPNSILDLSKLDNLIVSFVDDILITAIDKESEEAAKRLQEYINKSCKMWKIKLIEKKISLY